MPGSHLKRNPCFVLQWLPQRFSAGPTAQSFISHNKGFQGFRDSIGVFTALYVWKVNERGQKLTSAV